MGKTTDTIIFRILLWISRGLSVLLIAFVLFFLVAYIISDGFGQFNGLSIHEILMFVAFALMVAGSAIALKYQLNGGLLTIGGYFFFAILDKNFWPGNIIPLFLVTGLLHLYLWLRLSPQNRGKGEGTKPERP